MDFYCIHTLYLLMYVTCKSHQIRAMKMPQHLQRNDVLQERNYKINIHKLANKLNLVR